MNDIAYRILPFLGIFYDCYAKIVDVKTGFLYSNVEEEIYMECPLGMDKKGNKILVLTKSIYGLVQVARQWYERAVYTLEKIGFTGGSVDPHLYMRKN